MKILAIDAGGSKTRAILFDEDGNIMEAGIGGPANHLVVGIEGLKESLKKAIEGFEKEKLDIAVLGLAGLGFSESSAGNLKSKIKDIFNTEQLFLYNDCYIALIGALGMRKKGVEIVAGTGSMVLGYDGERVYKYGGWGHLLGDEGSGYRLSFDAIIYTMKLWEGRAEKSLLAEEVEKFFGFRKIDDVIRFFYNIKPSKEKIASFAPRFLKAIENKDRIARKILLNNLKELVEAVISASKRVRSNYITYSGGLFKSKTYKNIFKVVLRRKNLILHDPVLPPVGGAFLIALSKLNKSFDKNMLRKLRKELRKNGNGF